MCPDQQLYPATLAKTSTFEPSHALRLAQAKGQLANLAASHTGARVMQACAKFGSAEARTQLMQEILPQLLELAKSPYGHFTVVKLIQLVSKAELPGVCDVLMHSALRVRVRINQSQEDIHKVEFCKTLHVVVASLHADDETNTALSS